MGNWTVWEDHSKFFASDEIEKLKIKRQKYKKVIN